MLKKKFSLPLLKQLLANFPAFLFAVLLQVFLIPLQTSAQDVTVKGTVTGESGSPLSGVSVSVKGTTKGTTTDNNGVFSITAAKGSTLVISAVGYAETEVRIGNQNVLSIRLVTNEKALSEVVVIGYGTQRKEAVTGSVVSITGDKLREIPAPNITQAMQGRVAGVDIEQTSSKPGATMQIRIRGQRSLTASNDPLIVLDGIPFPGSIADINPNDIKSIEILKDASATAIYGSRGANGVIILTTNKGQKGGRAKISYNSYVGVQTLFAEYPMMNGPEFVAFRKAANYQGGTGVDENDSANINWQNLLYNKSSIVTSHDISVSGGTETGSFNFGGGYYQNQGLIPTQKYTRYSIRGSVDQQVGKLVRIGFTTNNNYNLTEGNQVGIYAALSTTPTANPYKTDGTLKRTVKMPQDENFVLTNGIVKNLHDKWLDETRGFATYNAIYGEVKIPWVEGLKYRVNLGLDFVQNNTGNYTGDGINSTNVLTPSSANVSNSQRYHWAIENLLTYDRTFGGKHTINAVALYSAEQTKFNNSSMSAKSIPVESFQFYNLGSSIDPSSLTMGGGYWLSGLVSAMGRVMYSYDNRYMLSATMRSDASSVLAPGNKWHTYPAISAGWNISNEKFMKGIKVVDKLKLRVGYGQTSNQAVNAYKTLGVLTPRQYNFGDATYATGYYVTELPNPALGWEYSINWNYGIDFSILKNRLSGTIEYYVTNTKDLLLSVGLPPTSGVSSYMANVGATQNKGVEFSLNGTILDNKSGWTWDAGINLYINNNKLVALSSGKTRDEGNGWFVGHNIDAIFDYEKIGLWQTAQDSAAGYLNTLVKGGNVGMIKVKYTGGYNADGTPKRAIGPDDRQIIDVDPDFQGGFNTRVAYKGFDLSIVGAFKSGGILISSLYGSGGYLNMLTGRRNNIKVDYWTPQNTDAKYPKPGGILSGDNPMYGSTLGYFDASYLKIRTISLGYDFNASLIKKSSVKMRMYFTVQNALVLFSPYHKESGMDPETNSYGNENAAVAMSYSMRRLLTIGTNAPATRNYVIGVNLSF